MTRNTHQEARAFQDKALWRGGFIDGDPLTPLSWTSYSSNGFVSIYHAAYLACIKPFVTTDSVVLEVGPGRGAWTKSVLDQGAALVHAVDVYDREHNGIDDYLGDSVARLHYIHSTSVDLTPIQDHSCDLFLSMACFVHLSAELQAEYFAAIFPKMKAGAEGFVQVADVEKWNQVVADPALSIIAQLRAQDRSGEIGPSSWDTLAQAESIRPRDPVALGEVATAQVAPGRYFYVGRQAVAGLLSDVGFQVVDADYLPSWRDPVVRFRKH